MTKCSVKIISLLMVVLLIISSFALVVFSAAADSTSDVTSSDIEASVDEATRDESKNRYYFYLPKEWENEYSDGAYIYWWEGTGAMEYWPGVKGISTEYEGLYYYDVPKDVTSIIWNNGVDGGIDFGSDKYNSAYQTMNIGSDYYEAGERVCYPEGVESFDNMVYVVDFGRDDRNDLPAKIKNYGEWFYYYGNGEYGITPEKGDYVYTARSYNSKEDDITVLRYRYYFYLPKEWENEYSDGAHIYWWEGTGAMEYWPGVKGISTEYEGLYYYDVPKDVTSIIWNNGVDGGIDFGSDKYNSAYQTMNIGTEFYWPQESDFYPDGLDNFDDMVYVVDPEMIPVSDCNLKAVYAGEWFYYYGDGTYGLTPYKGEEYFSDRTISLDDIIPPNYTEPSYEPYYTVYFANTEDWEDVKVFYWIEETDETNTWPGDDMTYVRTDAYGNDIYSFEISHLTDLMIITNGEEQTWDIISAELRDDIMFCFKDEGDNDPRWEYDIIPYTATDVPLGDSNYDGKVNIKDATNVQKYCAGFGGYNFYDVSVMNFNRDVSVNVKDATSIQKFIAGFEDYL